MVEKGTCQKHGEFILSEGCPQCIEEREGAMQKDNVLTEEILQRARDLPSLKPLSKEDLEALSQDSNIPPEEVESIELPKELEDALATETALALRPGEDIEARGYFKQAEMLLKYAESRVITTVEDIKLANDDLSIISKLKKMMEGKKRKYLEPLKIQTEAIRDTYNYLMAPILEADKITRGKMLDYDKEQKRIRQEQEEINRKRSEAAEAEMRLRGELTEPVNLVEVVSEAPRRVETEMGSTGQRDNWKYEVVDFTLVPDDYKMINAGVLTPVVKASKGKITIPGIRIYNEPIIANRAR